MVEEAISFLGLAIGAARAFLCLEHNPLELNRKRNNRDSQRVAHRRVSSNDDSGDEDAEALFA